MSDDTTLLAERMDITDLKVAQIEPLERLIQPEWSGTWCDLARSCFVTLISEPGADLDEAAERAVRLMLGIAQDIGGEQHYIQAGVQILKNRRLQQVIDLLASGEDYQTTARLTGLTEPGVRKIERRWRLAKRAAAEAQRAAEERRIASLQGVLEL